MPAAVQFVDSTKLPVVRNYRADSYRVAAGLAAWGRNWQGFWFGFKLHAAVDAQGRLSSVAFTPADIYDGHVTEQLVRPETKVWLATVTTATGSNGRSYGESTGGRGGPTSLQAKKSAHGRVAASAIELEE